MKVLSKAPNAYQLNHFMKVKKYDKCTPPKYYNRPEVVKYQRTLNNPDNPICPELKGVVVVSCIVLNTYLGCLVSHELKVSGLKKVEAIEPLKPLMLMQSGFVTELKEYLKGGWLKDLDKKGK